MAEVQRLGENPLRLPRRRWELPALALCVLTLASVFADPAGAQSSGSMGSESDVTARISIVVPERATFTIGLVDTVSAVIGGGKSKSEDGGEGEGEDQSEPEIAIIGGNIDLALTGSSYLEGATTISALGSGADGVFELEASNGKKIQFNLKIGGDNGRTLSPSEALSLADLSNHFIDLPDGWNSDDPDAVFVGVLTLMISPE